MAIDADKVPAAKPSASGLHLAAIEAAEMKQGAPGKVLFIDIRTRSEAMYVGMAPSWWTTWCRSWSFLKSGSGAARNEFVQLSNTHFVQDVENRLARAGLSQDEAVVLICRSGIRSNHAAGLLAQHGFNRAYNLIAGFEGDTAKDGERKGLRLVQRTAVLIDDCIGTRRAPLNRLLQYATRMSSSRTEAPERGAWMNFPSPT